MRRIASVQMLRFFAAFGVVTAHVSVAIAALHHRPAGELGQFGTVGVDVFFVISGFIMGTTALFASPPTTAGAFWLHRLRRIVPIYFLMAAPWTAWAVLAHRPFITDSALSTFLFWAPGSMSRGPHDLATPFLAVGWTLCFEMLFYAGVALVLLKRPALVLLFAIYVAAATMFSMGHGHAAAFLGSPLILEFLAGVALARWRPRPSLLLGAALAGGAVLAFAILYPLLCASPLAKIGDAAFITYPLVIWSRAAIYGTLAITLVAGALMLEPWATGAVSNRLAGLGDASYSLYLVHPGIVAILVWAWPTLGAADIFFAPAAIVAAVGASLLSFRGLERPLMSAMRRQGALGRSRRRDLDHGLPGGRARDCSREGEQSNMIAVRHLE